MAFHIKLNFSGWPMPLIISLKNPAIGIATGGNITMNLKGIQLTWLGHATFRIETPGGRTIIIDPWIMNNPACPPFEKKVKHVDVLLCTHGHGDHIGDAVEIIKQHNPQVVGMPELCGWLEKKGAKQTSMMNKGGTQKIGDIKVTMVHADHSCGIQDGDQLIYGGEACGYVIEFENGVKIYHAGDTNVFGDMAIIRELYAPEIVMLPIGDDFQKLVPGVEVVTMTPGVTASQVASAQGDEPTAIRKGTHGPKQSEEQAKERKQA
jgi:L-ascorbate metabolism protein UlaG (beta-lactamase superfamily)